MRLFKLFVFFLFIAPGLKSWSQTTIFYVEDTKTTLSRKLGSYNLDSLSQKNLWQSFYAESVGNGYLSLSLDSIQQYDDKMIFHVNSGERFTRVNLLITKDLQPLLPSKFNRKSPPYYNPDYYARLFKSSVKYLNNNGFLFAKVSLKDIDIDQSSITATLNIDKGPLIVLNDIENQGNLRITNNFLQSYLGLKKGQPVSFQKFEDIEKRCRELSFMDIKTSPTLILEDSLAEIKLNIDDARINSFSGIIGVMPNNSQDGGLLVTGDARISLTNQLGRGEFIFFEWRRLQVRTQSLKLDLNYPYIFGTSLGIDGQLDFFRKDTTFQNFRRNLGIRYIVSGAKFIRAFYEVYSSDAITQIPGTLPDFFDTRTSAYGLALHWENLDNRINPRRGYAMFQKVSFGDKFIAESNTNGFLVNQNVRDKSLSVQASLDWNFYFPISSIMVFHTSFKGASINNPYIFRNEVHRVGGFNSLRGFDEESIFASSFLFNNLETRLLLDRQSFLFGFFNYGFYEQKLVTGYSRDLPFGFGAGISLGTPAGILSVAYAVGASNGNSPEFRAAKIHFGYINTF